MFINGSATHTLVRGMGIAIARACILCVACNIANRERMELADIALKLCIVNSVNVQQCQLLVVNSLDFY